MSGIIARHLASLNTLFGMALSGVAIISVKTLADASIRFSISDLFLSSSAHQPMAENSNTTVLSTPTNLGTAFDRFILRSFPRSTERRYFFSCHTLTFGLVWFHPVHPVRA